MLYKNAGSRKRFNSDVPKKYFVGALCSNMAHIPSFDMPKNNAIENRALAEMHERRSRIVKYLGSVSGRVEVVDLPTCRVDISDRNADDTLSLYFHARNVGQRAAYYFNDTEKNVCWAVPEPFRSENPNSYGPNILGYERFAIALKAAEESLVHGRSIIAGREEI